MKIIEPSFKIMNAMSRGAALSLLEEIGRVCYKSEDKKTDDSAGPFIRRIIKQGHESVIEHVSATVKIVCDRGISHEIVRHRIASYSQESTRYCNYSNGKFGKELTFVKPCMFKYPSECYTRWLTSCQDAEDYYMALIHYGASPQEARSVLPNSLKTEIVVTMNLREWRHFFKLRTAKAAHPQMREIACMMLQWFKEWLPEVFEDIIPEAA